MQIWLKCWCEREVGTRITALETTDIYTKRYVSLKDGLHILTE